MRNCQLSHFQTSDPQKLWVAINVDCSFKSLNFGIICYIAIADKHSRFTKDHVTWVLYWKPSRKEVKFVQHGFSFLINTFWVLISPLLLRSVFWYILELSWNQNQADGSIIGKIYIFFFFFEKWLPIPHFRDSFIKHVSAKAALSALSSRSQENIEDKKLIFLKTRHVLFYNLHPHLLSRWFPRSSDKSL